MREEGAVAALALGANLDDPVAAFAFALDRLGQGEAKRILAVSSVYRTAPWGVVDQPDFLNMAARVETRRGPRALLDFCLGLETAYGRVRSQRWGPRALDIDLIDYSGRTLKEAGLTLPHPRAHERAFVLVPLAEIAPDLRISGRSARDLAAAMAKDQSVKRDEQASERLRSLLRL